MEMTGARRDVLGDALGGFEGNMLFLGHGTTITAPPDLDQGRFFKNGLWAFSARIVVKLPCPGST